MYIFTYTYIYLYMYIYEYIHINIDIDIHAYTYTYIYIYVYVYICIYIYIFIHIHINICKYIYKYICIINVYAYAYIWRTIIFVFCRSYWYLTCTQKAPFGICGPAPSRMGCRVWAIILLNYTCVTHLSICVAWHTHIIAHMGWLRFVGSLKFQVSFAKESYKRDDILQKRPIILRSLLIAATP